MKPSPDQIRAAADAIEAEMRRAGLWSPTPPPEAAFQFTRAFAADTMAFEQWLQFVLLPRVRSLLDTGGAFPPRSDVGVYAVREFDGRDETATLVTRLSAFDALFAAALPAADPRTRLTWKDWGVLAAIVAGLIWIAFEKLVD